MLRIATVSEALFELGKWGVFLPFDMYQFRLGMLPIQGRVTLVSKTQGDADACPGLLDAAPLGLSKSIVAVMHGSRHPKRWKSRVTTET